MLDAKATDAPAELAVEAELFRRGRREGEEVIVALPISSPLDRPPATEREKPA
jgi:hypothetical protein